MLKLMSKAVVVNLIGFQIAWFTTVLGAAHGMHWLGLIVVPLILAMHLFSTQHWRQELSLAATAALLGFAVDSALVASGVFTPIPYIWASPPWSPPWMVMLWVNQAAALNSSLAWMRERYLLGAAFGAIGGPLAYLSGAKLGAMSQLPTQQGLVILGFTWGVMFPLLLWLAANAATPTPPADPPREP